MEGQLPKRVAGIASKPRNRDHDGQPVRADRPVRTHHATQVRRRSRQFPADACKWGQHRHMAFDKARCHDRAEAIHLQLRHVPECWYCRDSGQHPSHTCVWRDRGLRSKLLLTKRISPVRDLLPKRKWRRPSFWREWSGIWRWQTGGWVDCRLPGRRGLCDRRTSGPGDDRSVYGHSGRDALL